MQTHVREAERNNLKVAALTVAQGDAASVLLGARAALAARETELKAALESSQAAAKLLLSPPEPLQLQARSLSCSDIVKQLTLDQLLDYTPVDSKVRLPTELGKFMFVGSSRSNEGVASVLIV